MFKMQFCGTVANRCINFPLFSLRSAPAIGPNQINVISSKALPRKYSEKEYGTRKKPLFKNEYSFPHSNKNISSFDEQPFGNLARSTGNESEQEFLVKAKNNPDIFGDTSPAESLDHGDVLEEKHFTEQPSQHRKLSTKQYADIIKGYVRQRKIKEAVDVLEIKMLQEDKVKPENYIYNLLLGACGRVGYTKKAFMLYNDMKKRGLKVTGGTYTALFNACANSPWPFTDGLTRAKHLYNIMIEKGDQPNDTNYNVMIKAFGRCGDLTMAFSLVDEMIQKGFTVKDDTINFLLQACITDKDSGFRHSLLVWRKLVEKSIQPSVHTFNLMLRCVRDCGLGDINTTKDVIDKLVGGEVEFKAIEEQQRLKLKGGVGNNEDIICHDIKHQESVDGSKKSNKGFILPAIVENLRESGLANDSSISKQESPVALSESLELRPNLLAEKAHLGNILSLSEVKKSEHRLLLLGGCKGYLETMSKYKCIPDIKTFTQLLDVIPSTVAAEKELIAAMNKVKIQEDIDFYNMLIKKKSLRLDYEGARQVLLTMKEAKLRPDLITYGVLSLGCVTKEQAIDLVNEMKAMSYTINAAILGAMLKQACFHMKFGYIFEIMELCLKERVPVNKKFLEHLESFTEKCRYKLNVKELNKKEVKLFGIFKMRYKTWLTEVQIDESEDSHPWQQYRQATPGTLIFKPKDTTRFKERHTSLFKIKTSTKHRNNFRK